MEEYYDEIIVVFLHEERTYGEIGQLGAFASLVHYQKDGIDYEVMMENSDFTIIDNFVIHHVEED